jgi:hypothetical protein
MTSQIKSAIIQLLQPLDDRRPVLDQLREMGVHITRVPRPEMPSVPVSGSRTGYADSSEAQEQLADILNEYTRARQVTVRGGFFTAQSRAAVFAAHFRASDRDVQEDLRKVLREALKNSAALSRYPRGAISGSTATPRLIADLADSEMILDLYQPLLDPSSEIRWEAIQAVQRLYWHDAKLLAPSHIVRKLSEMAKGDPEIHVRRQAAEVLGDIARRSENDAGRIAELLIQLAIHDDSPMVRLAARDAIINKLGFVRIEHVLFGTKDLQVADDVGPSLRSNVPMLKGASSLGLFGEQISRDQGISRRAWLGVSSLVIAAVTAAACQTGSPTPAPTTPPVPTGPPAPSGFISVFSAYKWLLAKINESTNFISSFPGLTQEDDDPSYGVTWTFNQGQAIEAIWSEGDVVHSQELLDGLLAVQQTNGAWHNAYVTATQQIATASSEQRSLWVGPNVVIGRALLSLYAYNGAQRYYTAALALAEWLSQFFVNQGTYGFLTDGLASDGNGVLTTIDYALTASNQRAMAFYYQLGGQYQSNANLIASWLNTQMWAGDHLYVGYTTAQVINTDITEATDVQYLSPLMAVRGGRDPSSFKQGTPWLLARQTNPVYNGNTLTGVPDWFSTGQSVSGQRTAEVFATLNLLGLNPDTAMLFEHTLGALQDSSGGILTAVGGTPGYPGTYLYDWVEVVAAAIPAQTNQPGRVA